jgi:hypothetical protein
MYYLTEYQLHDYRKKVVKFVMIIITKITNELRMLNDYKSSLYLLKYYRKIRKSGNNRNTYNYD